MYNNNKLRNHYSLSQKRIIPISNPIFPTNNHLNNYYNNYFDSFSSKNNINRKYDVSEINQIRIPIFNLIMHHHLNTIHKKIII